MSRHEELIEKRSELLNDLALRAEISARLRAGITQIIQGGEEGIVEVATQHPDIVITALSALVEACVKAEENARDYAELWFTAQDDLFELGEMMDNLKNLIQSED